jgi:phenylalanyl-tRNA synthetase alpha chain
MSGHLHPLTLAVRDIERIFSELGFTVALGPEVETEFYNFDALNVPADHPARDMQDTFWLKNLGNERRLLRTQTTAVQIRYLKEAASAGLTPPFRIIAPGKVFRNEATDATHEAQFHQIDGVVVDKAVSMAELKGTLEFFFKRFFGPNVQLRFRPSFFPFTEPSVEVDIRFNNAWLEVMGAGLIHPNVLTAAGLDAGAWNGFAFGGGIDRLVMIKHGISDVRDLYTGDLRLVNQF